MRWITWNGGRYETPAHVIWHLEPTSRLFIEHLLGHGTAYSNLGIGGEQVRWRVAPKEGGIPFFCRRGNINRSRH
jgi:hypothetical protein